MISAPGSKLKPKLVKNVIGVKKAKTDQPTDKPLGNVNEGSGQMEKPETENTDKPAETPSVLPKQRLSLQNGAC